MSLVSEMAWRDVRQAASTLPAALTDAVYLECRLDADAPQVDLIVRVGERGREILRGRNAVLRPQARDLVDPAWSRVRSFCEWWADAGPATARAVKQIWLEFDIASEVGRDAVISPSLFLELNEALDASAGWDAVIDGCVPRLVPRTSVRATVDLVRSVLARRPPGVRVPYLGFMLSRPDHPVRFYLRGIRGVELESFLGGLGLASPFEPALGLPADAFPPSSMVHLDMAGDWLPRVGIEYTLRRPCQARGQLAETEFVDALARAGLCDPEKRDGLLAWPGVERRRLSHELWPSWVSRRVNCIKLVHGAGLPPEAKGYLLTTILPAVRRGSASVGPLDRVDSGDDPGSPDPVATQS